MSTTIGSTLLTSTLSGSTLLTVTSSTGGQTFREALVAKLGSITELTAIVGAAIYAGAIPQTHDLGRDGPALAYVIVSNPRGEELRQLDGTSLARVQLSGWSYSFASVVEIAESLVGSLRQMPVGTWGDGSVEIMSISHQDERDQPEEPRAGTDQWVYSVINEYNVKYRVSIP